MQTHIIKLDNKEDSRAVKWVSLAMSGKKTPILGTILIDDNDTVACDRARIHRIETPAILKEYNQKALKPLSTIPANPQPVEYEEIDAGDQPDWKVIESQVADKEVVFLIAVDKNLLADLSKMPTGSSNRIILSFIDKDSPIKITAPEGYDKAEALIMPMQLKNWKEIKLCK